MIYFYSLIGSNAVVKFYHADLCLPNRWLIFRSCSAPFAEDTWMCAPGTSMAVSPNTLATLNSALTLKRGAYRPPIFTPWALG